MGGLADLPPPQLPPGGSVGGADSPGDSGLPRAPEAGLGGLNIPAPHRVYDPGPVYPTVAFLGMAVVLVFVVRHVYNHRHRPRRKRLPRIRRMPTVTAGQMPVA